MSWEDHAPTRRPCPCGKGHYTVFQRSDDWGRFEERWEMECGACKEKYGLHSATYNRKGIHETSSGWVPHAVLQEVAAARLRVEEADKRLTADAASQFGEPWRAHFDGKAKKTIWSELTEDGKCYPSLGTFYTHVRDSGLDRVLARYFDRRELSTVIRILGPSASTLGERMAEVERLERELDARSSCARQQAFS